MNTWTMHNDKRITMKLDQRGVGELAPAWAKQEWRVTLRHDGRSMSFPYYGGGMASDPTADDVVESLVMDSTALSDDFEEWAYEHGYDEDSRMAHDTFMACRKLAKRFHRLLGE